MGPRAFEEGRGHCGGLTAEVPFPPRDDWVRATCGGLRSGTLQMRGYVGTYSRAWPTAHNQ